jgi:hypothetical protein
VKEISEDLVMSLAELFLKYSAVFFEEEYSVSCSLCLVIDSILSQLNPINALYKLNVTT